VLRDGFVVNLLNPKTALFFLAFLPQFVEASRGGVQMQILFLGMLFVAIALLTDGTYALAAGAAGGWLKRSPRFLKAERFVSGGVFIGLGLTAAFTGNGKK
jgi:threonine/homoserine/homoserine lactone efflux protein